MSLVTCNNISVIVQGPIHHQESLTKRVLESVRTHLPNAELILSTWKGSDVSGLDCDVLLLNDDPGAINGNNNVNRQIVSTRNGLQKASRHYAVKLRTDTLLTGTGFLEVFDRYPERRDDFKVFQHKIVIPTLYTRNPLRFSTYTGMSHLFHPSDIFQFGSTADLKLLWNIPLAIFENRLFPEQYVWTACLKTTIQDINYFGLNLSEQLKLSQITLANNFVVETPTNLGIRLVSRLLGNAVHTCYTSDEVRDLHLRYIINGSNTLPFFHSFILLLYSPFIFSSGLELNFGLRNFLYRNIILKLTANNRSE